MVEHVESKASADTSECPRHGGQWMRRSSWHPKRPPLCEMCVRENEEAQAAQAVQEQAWRRLDALNLRGRFRACTLDSYQAGSAAQRAVLKACRDFANHFAPDQGHGLLLIGRPGTGKTHLAAGILQAVAQVHNTTGVTHTAREVVRMLRATWSRGAEWSEEEVIESLGTSPLLVLDEVGVGFSTEAEQTQLFDVLDLRYQLRRPTVVVSNLNMPLLSGVLGERLLDRLQEGAKVLVCDWPSYRIRGAE